MIEEERTPPCFLAAPSPLSVTVPAVCPPHLTLNVVDDDSATIMDKKGEINQLQKTANGWKIMLGANANADPQLAEFAMLMIEGIISISDTQYAMTEKLNAGEITSLEQLKQEMDAAIQASPF